MSDDGIERGREREAASRVVGRERGGVCTVQDFFP